MNVECLDLVPPSGFTAQLPLIDEIHSEHGNLAGGQDRKSTRLNSSHSQISYAVFCLKKKKNKNNTTDIKILTIHMVKHLIHTVDNKPVCLIPPVISYANILFLLLSRIDHLLPLCDR